MKNFFTKQIGIATIPPIKCFRSQTSLLKISKTARWYESSNWTKMYYKIKGLIPWRMNIYIYIFIFIRSIWRWIIHGNFEELFHQINRYENNSIHYISFAFRLLYLKFQKLHDNTSLVIERKCITWWKGSFHGPWIFFL